LIIILNKLNFKIVAPAKMALLGRVFFLVFEIPIEKEKEMKNILFCIFDSEKQLITKTND
jgi:hypothetical protein